MPEYLSPGVYIEEVDRGPIPIEGVSTSTAGFLGETERGPMGATAISSATEFDRVYGTARQVGAATWFVRDAVHGFFANGGQRCFIARVVGEGARAATLGITGAAGDMSLAMTVAAVSPGSWGNRVAVEIAAATRGDPFFKLVATYGGVREEHDDLTADPFSPHYCVARIDTASQLIRLVAMDGGRPPRRPVNRPSTLLHGGADGAPPAVADYAGHTDAGSGMAALAAIDEVAIVCAPDEYRVDGLAAALAAHCDARGDRFAILQAGPDASPDDVRPPVDSKSAAFYYPWLQVPDPVGGGTMLVPPGGHVAGVYARSDSERGVHKAPANEIVRGVRGLAVNVTDVQQARLNPRGVNCIREFPGRGILVWGGRTTARDPQWKYVNVRRLLIYLEHSIERGTQWVVFEPNAEPLWKRVHASVADFLAREWRRGTLLGAKPEEAFLVRCDGTTMTPEDVRTGRLVVLVGVAVVKPGEFLDFRLTWTCRPASG